MKQIKNWKGLPCWEEGEYNAIFSIVDNKMVIARCKKDQINCKKSIESLEQENFWQWKGEADIILNEKVLVLSLTEKCNCCCRYCFLDAQTEGKTMSFSVMRKAIDYAFSNIGDRKLKIAAFGGEPTTNLALLKEMVHYAKTINENKYPNTSLSFSITTNGIMNDETLNFLIINKFSITLSMDGMRNIQNYHRPLANGTGSFDIVLKNLIKMVEAKVDLNVRVTVTKFSVSQMSEIVRFFKSQGVNIVHFEAMCESGRGCNTNDIFLQAPTAEEFAKNTILAIQTAAEIGAKINCSPFVWCSGNLENRIVIGPTGMISSCVEIQSPDSELAPYFGMGEITECELVIHSNKIRHNGKVEIEKRNCYECPYEVICKRSCPSRNYHSTGSTCTTDTFKCEFVKKVMPFILHNFYLSTFKIEKEVV